MDQLEDRRTTTNGAGMNTLTWSDIDQAKKPGQYPFREGVVTIADRHIAIWEMYPEAVFRAVRGTLFSGGVFYALGSYVVPSGNDGD